MDRVERSFDLGANLLKESVQEHCRRLVKPVNNKRRIGFDEAGIN